VKSFAYSWDEEFFLLHIQLDQTGPDREFRVPIVRTFHGGESHTEFQTIKRGQPSFRFLISRTHPREVALLVEYPGDVVLTAYRLDDRAYFPTADEAFFRA
jgi:hypothetical protein